MTQLFTQFAEFLRSASETELHAEIERPSRLLIETADHRGVRLDVAYAPFDHVNPQAEVVIVGLTPGRQQMRNAILEAGRRLRAGASDAEAMEGAKVFASFSGPMRANLVAMLDDIGLAKLLGLTSVEALWGPEAGRVHFTSALRYPVFVNGANYSGAPDMLRTPILRRSVERWFAEEMRRLPRAIFVPLGPKVAAAVEHVGKSAGLPPERILSGLPHPSGANAERIAFFLGRKDQAALSPKTSPFALLAARRALLDRMLRLEGSL